MAKSGNLLDLKTSGRGAKGSAAPLFIASAVALLLFASGCGSGDTTTGAATSTSAENTTKSAGVQGGSGKGNTASKPGSAKKPPATDGSSREGAGAGKPNRSSAPQAHEHKKQTAKNKTLPQGISQNGHEVSSSPPPAEVEPQGAGHDGSHSPTPQAESGSGGH